MSQRNYYQKTELAPWKPDPQRSKSLLSHLDCNKKEYFWGAYILMSENKHLNKSSFVLGYFKQLNRLSLKLFHILLRKA